MGVFCFDKENGLIMMSSQTLLVPKKNLNEDFSSFPAMTCTEVVVSIKDML